MKATQGNNNNRISALNRLGQPKSIQQRLQPPVITDARQLISNSVITDARQLLSNRNKPVFDARQLLSRQTSKNVIENEEDEDDDDDQQQQQPVFITRHADGRLTSGNTDRSSDTKKNPFIKTIPNKPIEAAVPSDEKVVISFVNDQYRKRPKSPSPPPITRRLNTASIQATHSSRSSIQTSSNRKRLNEDEDHYEPPTKRPTTVAQGVKTPIKRSKPNSDAATVLITNLQSSVTEDDVIELFGEIGSINDIKTLSRGCVQIIYSKEEHAEQAVERFHNKLLDGQLMYVSLQQPSPSSYTTKSSKNLASSQHSKVSRSSSSLNNESTKSTSNKMTIDPSFIRQALFNPSDNTKNPVQFQVKL